MEKQEHDQYVMFSFRTVDNTTDKVQSRRMGYICVASKRDGEQTFITIAGSACSVSEEKFLKWKGTAIAKGRVDTCRPHIKKIETTLEEAKKMSIKSIFGKLGLRPTCSYMSEAQVRETTKRWDGIDLEDADEYFSGALEDIETTYDVEAEMEMIR